MDTTATDLCATEPIHIPGSIQPHGALLVLDADSLQLLQASRNAGAMLDAPALQPGADWPHGHPRIDAMLQWLRTENKSAASATASVVSHTLDVDRHRLHLQSHPGPQGLMVEVEASTRAEAERFDAMYPAIRRFVDRIEGVQAVRELCGIAAAQVRALTGFDRVMVYQFSPQWHGTVIAEDGNGTLPSYLGLRFPASDIPAQARALYTRTRLRMIPDAWYEAVPVLPATSPVDGQPLDMSSVSLRSVSPVHLQYMRNMGTAASMSISILVNGSLWGLISCHHAQARVLGPLWRGTCDFIGQLLAMQIEGRERGAYADARLVLKDVESTLLSHVVQAPDVASGLVSSKDAWLRVAGAGGAAIVQEGKVLTVGVTPGTAQIEAMATWLRQRHTGSAVFATHELPRHLPEAAAYADSACGLLAVPISALHAHYILWFRPELVHTVRWGGEPTKATDEQGRLHPRSSFAQWVEEVRGHAEPWSAAERDAVDSLRNAITTFVLKRAEERAQLTEKLESTNRELEAFSYSVSHDLRAPFRHVVGYAQLLREQSDVQEKRSRHYLDSIIAAAMSAGQLVDDLLNFSQLGRAALDTGRVDMNKLVAELRRSMELDSGQRNLRWDIAPLPPAFADAGLLRQAMGNLLDNAIKYSRDRDPAVITISGEDRPHETVYSVRDNGVGFDMAYGGKIFGVFQRLHRAEDFEGTGIGLALARRIIDRHGGWIAAEGRVDQGAVFRIGLPKPGLEVTP